MFTIKTLCNIIFFTIITISFRLHHTLYSILLLYHLSLTFFYKFFFLLIFALHIFILTQHNKLLKSLYTFRGLNFAELDIIFSIFIWIFHLFIFIIFLYTFRLIITNCIQQHYFIYTQFVECLSGRKVFQLSTLY